MSRLTNDHEANSALSDSDARMSPDSASAATERHLSPEATSSAGREKLAASPASVQSPPPDEFSALNALIQDRAARWSKEARALKFDIEFKAIEQERRRVAKELHDEILPALARLIRNIQSQDQTDSSIPVIKQLHETVESFRDFLGELHPVDLEELGLVYAMSNICARYARLTDRCVVFIEVNENCHLSKLQQLCVYRAVQCMLRMFAESENDLLLLSYDREGENSLISVQCVDKRVSSAEWLTAERDDFTAFESWCDMAGAQPQIGTTHAAQFRSDLLLSITENQPSREDTAQLISQLSQIRLAELDSIVAHAQEEWSNMIHRDCVLFENLAIAAERRRISTDIEHRVVPHIEESMAVAEHTGKNSMANQVRQCMQLVTQAINAVMADAYPQVLAKTGLIASIKILADRFKRSSLIDTTIDSNLKRDDIDASIETKFAIYRVVQEALNNVEKHSHATRTTITIHQLPNELLIAIEDNGTGFQSPRSTLSRGLKNIKERAATAGAQVSWTKAESFDSGTLLSIRLVSQ